MSEDAFASSPPPHAFPSPYPPTCRYDPFPCEGRSVCFGKPVWRRVLDGKRRPLPIPTSIDDLTERFSNLNVRDGTRANGSLKLRPDAATAAITVIPSRAPHPSLIVRKYPQPQPTNVVQLPPLVRAPVSVSKAFQSPGPNSAPATLVHLSNKNEPPGKRKTAPLPRRFPGQTRNTRRDTTPPESSSTSSSSPRLFSPATESRSCSFSSASLPSTPSDTASTRELPHLFESPCRSSLDNPIYLRGLGDVIAISPSSVS